MNITFLDNTPSNRDWIRTLHWDLPTDWDQFLLDIGGPTRLPQFMILPAAQAMPADLKAKAEELISSTKSLEVPFTKSYVSDYEYVLKSIDEARDEKGRWTADGEPDRLEAYEDAPEFGELIHHTSAEAKTSIESSGFSKMSDGAYGTGIYLAPKKVHTLYRSYGKATISTNLTGVSKVFRVSKPGDGEYARLHWKDISEKAQAIVVGNPGKESMIIVFDPKNISINTGRK
jgi:hypothetical protein